MILKPNFGLISSLTTNFTGTKASIDGLALSMLDLDAKTQKVIISMATKDKVQRQNITTTLQQLQSGQLLSGQQALELVTQSQLTQKQQQLLLSKLGLNQATAQNTVVNNANLVALINKLVTQKKLGKANAEELIGIIANTTATKAQTTANLGLAGSFKALMASMGPIGWISLIVSVLPMISELTKGFTDAGEAMQKFEEASSALEKNKENITNFNNEIDTLTDLSKKLDEARGDKISLIEVQSELNKYIGDIPGLINDETAAYNIAKAKISELTQAKKELLNFEKKYAKDNARIMFENATVETYGLLGIDFLSEDRKFDDMGAAVSNAYKDYYDEAGLIEKFLIQLGMGVYEETNYQAAISKRVEAAKQFFASEIENYNGFGGQDLFNSIINKYAGISGISLDDIEEIFNVVKEKTNPLTEEFYSSLEDPNADIEKIFNNLKQTIASLSEVDQSLPDLLIPFLDSWIESAKEAKEETESAEPSIKSIAQTLVDSLEKLADKKDILEEVKDQINEFGAISADNISSIVDKFSDNDAVLEIVAGYLAGINTAQELYAAMANGYQDDLRAQASTLATKMQNVESYYNAIGANDKDFIDYMQKNYDIDLTNCTNLAKAKFQIEKQLVEKQSKLWQSYYKAQGNSLSQTIASDKKTIEALTGKSITLLTDVGLSNLRAKTTGISFIDKMNNEIFAKAIARYKESLSVQRSYNAAVNELNNLATTQFTSSGNFNSALNTDFSDGNEGKTKAEKDFDYIESLRENDFISEKEYYRRLAVLNERHYTKNGKVIKKYAEEYAENNKKLYEGMKNLYEKDLEAQKDALEKKKDAIEKYYDNIIDKRKEQKDEDDYQKDLAEKNKTLFDIQQELWDIRNLDSESAKRRRTELEDELAEAQKELDELAADHAYEQEMERLEKEKEAKIAAIQKKIDEEITPKLDAISENSTTIRKTIVEWAKKKHGITVSNSKADYSYATGTNNATGGLTRINEKGMELVATPDGHGNYVNMLPASKVLTAQQTATLMALSQGHLPQAMYNSIARSIGTKVNSPTVSNFNQPITIQMGDIVIKGNADKQTVSDIKKQQENMVRAVLQAIKDMQLRGK